MVGLVTEFNGLSELDATATGGSVTDGGATTAIAPHTGSLPGTDCAYPGTACLTGSDLAAAQEAHEGELWDVSDAVTVTDAYDGSAFGGDAWGTTASGSMFGEVGLAANSDQPLVAPTEVVDAQDAPGIAGLTAYNKAHQLVLDDASSITYWNTTGTGRDDLPFPYFTKTNPVRVGESVTFNDPMIYSDGFGTRRLIPLQQVTDDGTSAGVDFSNNRPAGPADVGGDIKLATFNVLNFFPVSAAEYVALNPATNACTAFLDREDNPIAVNSCTPNGPRGAWDDTNLRRQRIKIVHAINAVDADVVSLEELENSVQFGRNRDDAISKLVAALNADAGSTRWAYVPSPAAADLPPLAEQDVIRTGFIYNPHTILPVGASKVLVGASAFNNAREPLAQAFKIRGTGDASTFGVIVNHFKSKGSGTPDPDGQGNSNVDRVAQANALLTFADQFKADRGITKEYLTGDFNAYSEEDPVQEIEKGSDDTANTADDWTALEDTVDGTESYSFSGLSGSLDHIFVNDAAEPDVTGVDVLDINASEFVYNLYSRYNYDVTNFYDRTTFYGASDHNPEVIGITSPNQGVEIQVLATNDFHGRIANDPGSAAAGAAVMAGAVKQLRAENPNTVFAAAGDLIGASTFESFIAHDKPTIDALNSAGLEVSSAGNHEFDQGYDDLVNRVMKPYNASTNPYGGANWQYIARQSEAQVVRSRRPHADVDQDDERRQGGLRRCGHRAPAGAGVAGRHQRHRGRGHRDLGQREGRRAEGRRRRRRGHARARGCRWHRLCRHGRQPVVRLRQHHHRDRRQRRRHRLRPHPPRVQLLVPGGRLGRSSGDGAAGGLGGSVRRRAQPAQLRRRPGHATRSWRSVRRCSGSRSPTAVRSTTRSTRPRRRSSTPRSPTRTCSAHSRSARSPTASVGPSSTTARRRTVVASRRSATWSRRPSAGPPATRSRARRRSPS